MWSFLINKESIFAFQEKVTDYAEEKEIIAASTAVLDDAIATVRKLRFLSHGEYSFGYTPLGGGLSLG